MIKTKIDAGIRVYFCRNSAHASEIPSAISKLELTDDVFVEPVPCSGRIDPRYILKAFEGGARAVCVLTCPTGHVQDDGRQPPRHAAGTCRSRAARRGGLDPEAVQHIRAREHAEDTLDAAVTDSRRRGSVASGARFEEVPV